MYLFISSTGAAVTDITDAARRAPVASPTRRKMTAERGRAPVVTARAIAEWRFGYRKSEYNIGVLSVSAFLRASDVTDVPAITWWTSRRGRVGELRRRTRRLFTRRQHVSRRRSTITVLRNRCLTLTAASRDSRRIGRRRLLRVSRDVSRRIRAHKFAEQGREGSKRRRFAIPVTLTLISASMKSVARCASYTKRERRLGSSSRALVNFNDANVVIVFVQVFIRVHVRENCDNFRVERLGRFVLPRVARFRGYARKISTRAQ